MVNAPAGTRLPDVPKFKFAGNARYEFAVGGNDAFVQASYQHVGSRWNNLFVASRELQASYNIVNFSAGINFERFSVSAFLNNAFDERAELNRNAATYDERITTNRPRTIGIRLCARF